MRGTYFTVRTREPRPASGFAKVRDSRFYFTMQDSRFYSTMRDSRSEAESAKTRPLHFNSQTRDSHSEIDFCQNATFAFQRRDMKSAFEWPRIMLNLEVLPHGFKASSSSSPATDLRDYLTKKWSVHQITLQCCCKRLITTILSEYHSSLHTSKLLVFNRLSVTPPSNSA